MSDTSCSPPYASLNHDPRVLPLTRDIVTTLLSSYARQVRCNDPLLVRTIEWGIAFYIINNTIIVLRADIKGSFEYKKISGCLDLTFLSLCQHKQVVISQDSVQSWATVSPTLHPTRSTKASASAQVRPLRRTRTLLSQLKVGERQHPAMQRGILEGWLVMGLKMRTGLAILGRWLE